MNCFVVVYLPHFQEEHPAQPLGPKHDAQPFCTLHMNSKLDDYDKSTPTTQHMHIWPYVGQDQLSSGDISPHPSPLGLGLLPFTIEAFYLALAQSLLSFSDF